MQRKCCENIPRKSIVFLITHVFVLCIRRISTIRILSQSVRRDKVQLFLSLRSQNHTRCPETKQLSSALAKIVMAISISETVESSVSKARMCRLRLTWRSGSVLRFRECPSMDKSELTTSSGYLYMRKRQNSGSSYFIECVSLIQTVLSERFWPNILITNEFVLGILLHLTYFFLGSFYHLLILQHIMFRISWIFTFVTAYNLKLKKYGIC